MPDDALALLTRGAAQVISPAELQAKLALGRPLRVKLGVDPTSADIHLGHTLAIRKLRQFQDLGHEAILIIGDFTALIGDPSGRSVTRPQLTPAQVQAHATTYREQALKILDEKKTRIVYNSEWFRPMTFEQVIQLNSRVTLQQMLQREDFKTRLQQDQPVRAHEIQYPIMQGWDSVMVEADVELGGSDQLFNILVGRDLQKAENKPQQVVLLVPILEGLDGSMKMSKSLNNYVGVNEPAPEMFGKIMSISDTLMARYYELLLGRTPAPGMHPLEAKKELAREITQTYHGADTAARVLADWNARFSEKRLAEADLPAFAAPSDATEAAALVVQVYAESFQTAKSKTEARRLLEQGSVQLNGEKIRDPKVRVALKKGDVLRLDKTRAVRLS